MSGSGAEAVLAAADKIAANAQAIAAIHELHAEIPCRRYADCSNPRGLCGHCGSHHPCPTIAILEEHGLS